MAGGGSIQWGGWEGWDPVEGSDIARHQQQQQGAAAAAVPDAAAQGQGGGRGGPSAPNHLMPPPLRTMSNAELDALLNNLAAGNAAANTSSSSSSASSSSMMPSSFDGGRSTTAYTNQDFAPPAPPQARGQRNVADAATAASTAAAVAALQANGLMNPLGASSSANAASTHGFDWTQPDNNNASSMAGLGLGPTAQSSFNDDAMYSAYQGGRASWDGSTTRSSALAPVADHQGGQGPLTPGQESSDSGGNTSSASTKRRRMTFSGVDSSHQAGRGRPSGHGSPLYPPPPPAPEASAAPSSAQQSRRTSGALAASPTALASARMGSGNHLVNSRDLEAMATESLQRASAENSRSIDGAGNLSAMPPAFAPGLAHHQQQQQRQRQLSKNAMSLSAEDSSAGQSSSVPMASQLSSSHPTALGSTTLLRGQEGASSGAQAAHEFTRRKGWAHRVMDELLDFAHILDTQGRIIHVTNSIQGITGWKPESLKGRSIFSFVHPQDIPALQRQLQRSLETDEDMLLYYRFRRNPATIAARAKTRLGVDNGAAAGVSQPVASRQNRSPSDATSSPTDSSAPSTSEDTKPGGSRSKPRPSTVGDVDPDADWVTFEMSGHVYHVPVDVDLDAAEEKAADGGAGGSGGAGVDEDGNANPKANGDEAPRPRVKKYDLPLSRQPDAQCFFCSCRVYPSKGVTVLDSFLELKLENEKLRKQLEDLKLVEESGPDPANSLDSRFPRPGPSVIQSHLSSRSVQSTDSVTAVSGSYDQIPRGSGDIGGGGSSSHHLSEAGLILRRKHSTSAKKKSQDAAVVASQGGAGGVGASSSAGSASTGGSSTATTTNASSATPTGDDDRVCTDCGRTDSPEWRKGPLGPKTLCNACGLRYAKRVKKKAQSGTNLAAPPQIEPVTADDGEGGGGSFYERRDSLPSSTSKTTVRVPSNGVMSVMADGVTTPRQQHQPWQQHQHHMPGMLYGTSDFGGSPAASAGSPVAYGSAQQRPGMMQAASHHHHPPPPSPYSQPFTQSGFMTQHGGGGGVGGVSVDGMSSSAFDPYQQQAASGSHSMFTSGSDQGHQQRQQQQQQQHYLQQQQGHGHSSYGGQQPW